MLHRESLLPASRSAATLDMRYDGTTKTGNTGVFSTL
jgi:hypothetical protein